MRTTRPVLLALALFAAAPCSRAADDEIQVYNDDINAPAEFGLEVHLNYVTAGSSERAWPQQVPPKDLLRVTPEFSYGLAQRWELGLYLPATKAPAEDFHLEGAKLRLKFLDAPQGQALYWGVNVELGRLTLRTVEQHWNAEIRPIIGYRQGDWHVAFNPRLAFALSEGASRVPEFNPCISIMRRLSEDWAVGVEHYAEYGPVNNFLPPSQRAQNTYLAVNGRVAKMDFNVGVGKGWTEASDRVVLKAILGFSF